MKQSSPWLDRVTWIVGITTTIGMASQSAVSWIVDALIKSAGMSVQDASLMAMVELVVMGATMLLLAPVIHRLPHKALVLAGVAGALAAQGLSSAVHGVLPMGAFRAMSGIAFGAIYAVAAVSGAAAESPERAYATGASINMVLGMGLNPPLGFGSEHGGYVGVFGALAAYCLLLALPLVFIRFPQSRKPRTAALQGQPQQALELAAHGASPQAPASRPPGTPSPRHRMRPVGVLLVMGLFALATNGVFVFFVSIAGGVGLSGTELGTELILVSGGAALGIALAGPAGQWIGRRFRGLDGAWRGTPIFLSMIAMGAGCAALVDSPSAVMFLALFTLWCIIYWIAYTFILGLAVAVDSHGRLAAAAGAVLVLLNGLGSAVGGYFEAHFGGHRFGLVALLACSVGGIVGLLLERSLERRGSLSSAPAVHVQ